MKKNEERIAIYSRKSKFTGKGESIGNQIELCREYVRAHYGEEGLQKVSVYEDEGFSGGNLNRPAFRNMMNAAREGEVRAIIVYRLDRISRSISDFSGLIGELDRLDIAFVSVKEQFDTGTPMGRAMMYIASVFSQLERETIAERIRDNMHELAKTGRWLGGTTPAGYASESVESISMEGKTKRVCRLKLIPEEAEAVRMIYELYMEHDSLAVTEAELRKRGVRTRKGKDFTRFSIRAILQNPVYMIADADAYGYFSGRGAELFAGEDRFDGVHGIMAYNRTDQQRGRTTVYRPISEWIVSVGRHPGIITGNMWTAVQKSLERNGSKTFRKPRNNEALLTGLLYCSCGSRMYPRRRRGGTEEGEQLYTYVCRQKEHRLCGRKNLRGVQVDRAVLEALGELEEDRDILMRLLRQNLRLCREEAGSQEEQLTGLCREREKTERKIEGLVDALASLKDGSARRSVAKRIEQLDNICRELEERIHRLERKNPHSCLEQEELEKISRKLSVFPGNMEEMTLEQKRALVRALVRRVEWDGQEVHVVLYGAQIPEGEHWGEDSK